MANESDSAETSRDSVHDGGVKETIESILVAFILAFIFRAFVVEAFVIPTGSMGPTLMGAHFRVTCPDCGYHFEKNYTPPRGKDDTDIDQYGVNQGSMTCPNCGYSMPFAGNQPVYFGDRILVLKYRYLFQQPQPWDVVVFKSPYEKDRDPNDSKYVDNYIKRLIALPGESVMILDGDIYIGRKDQKPQEFRLRRKASHAQPSLWRDVYDNDYLSRGVSREMSSPWQEPWVVESGQGWKGPLGAGNASRVFEFENQNGESAIHFDSNANHPSFDALTDWLAYDQVNPNVYVGDLKLSCVYRRHEGQGPLRLQLSKRQDCFTAEFTPGKVTLRRNKVTGLDPLQTGDVVWSHPLQASVAALEKNDTPVVIEFSNVDYRVSVRVNGREVLATTDADYYPDIASLYAEEVHPGPEGRLSLKNKPVVRIVAAEQNCMLEHLHLSKDIYYVTLVAGNIPGRHLEPDASVSSQPYYASPQNIMNLGPDEYFVLGDNSQVSLDARYWGAPVNLPREGDYHAGAGRVPGRFLLGKAFFVYWPAGYRPPSLSFGIEPDFGDMRFIK